jgi:hypothetical protein
LIQTNVRSQHHADATVFEEDLRNGVAIDFEAEVITWPVYRGAGLLAILYESPRGKPVNAFKHSRKMESISKLELRRDLFYQHSVVDQ